MHMGNKITQRRPVLWHSRLSNSKAGIPCQSAFASSYCVLPVELPMNKLEKALAKAPGPLPGICETVVGVRLLLYPGPIQMVTLIGEVHQQVKDHSFPPYPCQPAFPIHESKL